MVYIKKKPGYKYNPLNLPEAIDFNLSSKEVDLSREIKTRFQIQFSKMDRTKLKETAEYLDDMRYTALRQQNYKMAAYCKSVKAFLDKYVFSLKAQKRI